ncbi:MAG: hypothetical protein ACK2UU_14370 [Anaerolineae bacterium]
MNTQRGMLTIVFAMLLAAAVAVIWSLAPSTARANGTTRYVAPPPAGDDANPCLLSQPCATVQHAVDVAPSGGHILVATGDYTGVNTQGGMTQVVYIAKSVSVRGGYSTDFNTWDPVAYPTSLDAEGAGRVVSIVGPGITATLDSLMITGGDATGITLNCPNTGGASDGCGGGVFIDQAETLVVGNVISGNLAAVSTGSNSASGGGIFVRYGYGTVITGNLIANNFASQGVRGMGGGIHLYYANGVQVVSNRLIDNVSTTSVATPGWGGGIAIGGSGAVATISGNWIEGNRTNGSTGYGAGIYHWYGASTFTSNVLTGNVGPEAVYLGAYEGGRFEANQVISNTTDIGIRLVNGSVQVPTLVNNVVASSGDTSLHAQAGSSALQSARLLHNTLSGEGTGNGVYVATGYVTLELTNNIVANHASGIVNSDPVNSTVIVDHTLFWNNGDNGIIGTNPVYGDPVFVNADGGDYHIGPGSAAIDAALDIGELLDVDGDARPIGPAPDIGADEARLRVYLPVILRGGS